MSNKVIEIVFSEEYPNCVHVILDAKPTEAQTEEMSHMRVIFSNLCPGELMGQPALAFQHHSLFTSEQVETIFREVLTVEGQEVEDKLAEEILALPNLPPSVAGLVSYLSEVHDSKVAPTLEEFDQMSLSFINQPDFPEGLKAELHEELQEVRENISNLETISKLEKVLAEAKADPVVPNSASEYMETLMSCMDEDGSINLSDLTKATDSLLESPSISPLVKVSVMEAMEEVFSSRPEIMEYVNSKKVSPPKPSKIDVIEKILKEMFG